LEEELDGEIKVGVIDRGGIRVGVGETDEGEGTEEGKGVVPRDKEEPRGRVLADCLLSFCFFLT